MGKTFFEKTRIKKFSRLLIVSILGLVFLFSKTPFSKRLEENKIRLIYEYKNYISSKHSFVIACNGKSFLFIPAVSIFKVPFLKNVYKPFGFSNNSKLFLYLKSNNRRPTFFLYIYDIEQNEIRPILDQFSIYNAVWSPNSLKIAFVAIEKANYFNLGIYDISSNSLNLIFSGWINPDFLTWSPDGKKLLYISKKPLTDNYHQDDAFEYILHEYQINNKAENIIPKARWAQYYKRELIYSISDDLYSARTIKLGSYKQEVFPGGNVINFTIKTDKIYITQNIRGRFVVYKYDTNSNFSTFLAEGEIYKINEDGLIIRKFTGRGVIYKYIDFLTESVHEIYSFTSSWNLPYSGQAYLTQGGSGYADGSCDGANCNIWTHTGNLSYALDFQQQSTQGNEHVLVIEDGTVSSLDSNVFCNSADWGPDACYGNIEGCFPGIDNYSSSCADNGGWGNYIIIAHPDGSFSKYTHLRSNSQLVSENENVCRGLYLADQGHTGMTCGNYNQCGDHIHFQRQVSVDLNSQSIPTDFVELDCNLSCGVIYTSQNEEVSSCQCSISVGQGTFGADLNAFQDAYNRAGGRSVLGCPTNTVQSNGFTSFTGTTGHYQTFDNGVIEYIAYNPDPSYPYLGQAFAIVEPLFSKWASLGFSSDNPLGYPTGDLSSQSTSCFGTDLKYQKFEGGALEYHLNGPRTGSIYEVHGAIYTKWGQKGYAGCPLGLPISDERDCLPSEATGKTGRICDFEGGHIHWWTSANEAYETHGSIDSLYLSMRGTASWLGFPISDQYTASTGYPRSDFEGGYITTLDGVNYQAFEYADNTPPSPNPMTWATEPYETGTSSISMVATTASDSSTPIVYYFDFYSSPTGGSGSTDSSWQTSTSYTDSGLQPNHQYGYRVKAKDANNNETNYSAVSNDYTAIETPSGMTFGTISNNNIQARSSNTPSGLTRGSSGLIIENVTKGTASGWKQNNNYWTSGSLFPNTRYDFRARARNGDGTSNGYCSTSYRYTLANSPGAASFSNVTESSIQANWTSNGNPSGTQYLCENVTKGTNSGWTTNTSWNSTGLSSGTSYTFRVKAKNGDGVETSWTNLGSQATKTVDNTPPSPNPMTWATEPYETSTSSISMVVTTASDPSTPVQYYFDFYTTPTGGAGGTDSPWQSSTSYTDSGLQANHQYGYRVKAKDANNNETTYSLVSYDYTSIETPSAMAFGTVTNNSIQAKSSNTPSGLTRGGSGLIIENVTRGTNSGWKQNNNYWTSSALSSNTRYGFRARTRNGDGTSTGYCSTSYRYTLANSPGAASFSNVTESSIQANWAANGNSNGTQYFCENVTKGTNSGWTTNTSWNSTGLSSGTSYTFRVKAKNGDGVETSWTNLGSQSPPFPHAVSTPNTPSGPSSGKKNIPYTYTTGGSSCSLGHSVEYRFDWGDGTYSTWSNSTSTSHSWSTAKTYTVKAQARCSVNNSIVSNWSSGKTVNIKSEETAASLIAYLKKGGGSAANHDLYLCGAPTRRGEMGAYVASDFWRPDGNTVAIAGVDIDGDGTEEIAYLKKGGKSPTDYNLYICAAPTRRWEMGTYIASDFWRPDGNTVDIAGVDIDGDGIDEIAYLKKGGKSPTDYNLYICSAPTRRGEMGTYIASDFWRPDGDTVAIAGVDIDGNGTDEIAYLKKGGKSPIDYNLYICGAPTGRWKMGSYIASDFWRPLGNTVSIAGVDVNDDGIDEIAYLKRAGAAATNYNLYICGAPTGRWKMGAYIASDFWRPDGQSKDIAGLKKK